MSRKHKKKHLREKVFWILSVISLIITILNGIKDLFKKVLQAGGSNHLPPL